MGTTQRVGITLPTLIARERAWEHWLLQEVGLAYDALKADLTRAVSMDQVRSHLATMREKAAAKT